MLTLNDGRSELWQWDTNRKLTVDADCSQVHFSNKVFGRSIDVDVVDGVAEIPDILLQTDKDLSVWAFVGTAENGYTKISKVFKVNRRNKPADYVFTPSEQTTLAEIMKRIDDLEAIQDPDAIKNAVDDYLANNPIKVEEKDPTVPEWAKEPTPPDVKIPDKLPNPNSITFTGAVNASYDGSSPVEIKIPDSGGNVDYAGVEPAEDDIPKIFFGGALQQTKDEKVVPFRYISKTEEIIGFAEIKAQGNSSMSYPKKNQTVKMFKDADCTEKLKVDFKGWGKQNKHVYKANWIDLTHARNVVSARLWGDVLRSRADYESLPELLRTSPNQGAVDGFPVKVYAAGVYQGRYTLNIPKDKWTFNMDDELDEHCVLCGENYVSGCFRAAANINGNDWTDEIHDVVPESIKTRWNEVISFVMNSTDEEFKTNLSQYFYVDSLIDYYLFGLSSCGLDAFGKNQIYATYDGQKWIASMYDMDSTWGLYWNGSKFVATDYGRNQYEDYVNSTGNLLYVRLEQLFVSELQARWNELKNGALSIENIINRFERFTDIAPAELVKEDFASTTGGGKFTGIPSQTTNNIQQIRAYALARQAWTDEYVAGLTPEVEVPCTGIYLNTNTLTFTAEGSQTLTATVTPDGCTDTVTWESDNTSVATVSGGVVTAIANGSATITAKCGEYSASCAVAVSGIAEPVPCTGITLDKTELTFDGEGTQTITATVTPSDTTDSVVWVSSNPAVASITVEGNVCTVQSVGNGNAVITVTCGEYFATCSVTVSGIETVNLLADAEFGQGYINSGNGQYTAAVNNGNNMATKTLVSVEEGATYTVSCAIEGNPGIPSVRVAFFDADEAYTNIYFGENGYPCPCTFTVPKGSNIKYIRLHFVLSGAFTDASFAGVNCSLFKTVYVPKVNILDDVAWELGTINGYTGGNVVLDTSARTAYFNANEAVGKKVRVEADCTDVRIAWYTFAEKNIGVKYTDKDTFVEADIPENASLLRISVGATNASVTVKTYNDSGVAEIIGSATVSI